MSSTAEPKLKKAKIEDSEESHAAVPKTEDGESGQAEGGGEEEETAKVEVLKNENGESYIDISAKKRVTVRNWKDNVLIDIREFYEKNDKMMPGKKGISLTVDQYKVIRDAVKSGQFDEIIRQEGGDV